jgi:N-acyl-D-amino-acid deacylase
MGVTTVITGNCGSSYLPIGDALTTLTRVQPGINVGTLVGHGTIRGRVMGNVNRDPSTTEVAAMQELSRQAMVDGAFGLASGLIYTPGTWGKTDELIAITKPVAEAGGIYTTHMRSEGMAIDQAIDEAVTIAKTNKMPLQISHFKITAPKRHGETSLTIGMVEKARAEGVDVTVDQYLYTASSTGIRSMLPDWAIEGTTSQVVERITQPANRQKIIEDIVTTRRASGRKDLSQVTIVSFAADRSINGMDIASIARKWGRGDSFEAQAGVVVDIVTSGGAGIVSHSMDEMDVQSIARYPNTMFASDSGIRTFGQGVPHPRGYGNNARALGRYARDLKLFSVEECVRKMTSLPARTFRLKDRGLLRPGMVADLVLFDLDKVHDPSTFQRPHAYAEGFPEVWVNGRSLITGGQLTSERAGRVLRGPGYRPKPVATPESIDLDQAGG